MGIRLQRKKTIMFYYTIEYYDDEDHELKTESGLTCAKNYGDATEKVARYYGQDHVCQITISKTDDILTMEDIGELK